MCFVEKKIVYSGIKEIYILIPILKYTYNLGTPHFTFQISLAHLPSHICMYNDKFSY